MTNVYRHSPQAIAAAYARSAVGLTFTLVPLWLVHPSPWISAVLAAGSALFFAYALKALCCHVTRISLDDAGITTSGPLGAAVRWDELQSLRLNYYATRGDNADACMQLAIRGARGSIRIESTVEGFTAIAAGVAREAVRRHRAIDERTRYNLAAIGIVLDGPPDFQQPIPSGAVHA